MFSIPLGVNVEIGLLDVWRLVLLWRTLPTMPVVYKGSTSSPALGGVHFQVKAGFVQSLHLRSLVGEETLWLWMRFTACQQSCVPAWLPAGTVLDQKNGWGTRQAGCCLSHQPLSEQLAAVSRVIYVYKLAFHSRESQPLWTTDIPLSVKVESSCCLQSGFLSLPTDRCI